MPSTYKNREMIQFFCTELILQKYMVLDSIAYK